MGLKGEVHMNKDLQNYFNNKILPGECYFTQWFGSKSEMFPG